MLYDSVRMSSQEHNFLNNKNGPESPSILSVNPHVIPTVSAKLPRHHKSSENVEWDPTCGVTNITTSSPYKE